MTNDGAAEWGRPYQRFDLRKKMYRKRRKHTGEEFTDKTSAELEELEKAKREDKGLYCKNCHRRRGWSQLRTYYSGGPAGDVYRAWYCDLCGNVLREDKVSGNAD